MTETDLLIDWLNDLVAGLREEVRSLTPAQLAWQPDPDANSLGVTLWDVSRWLDVLVVKEIQNQPPEQELWHTQGWQQKTGYDPCGVGQRGLGTVTGYTWDEVQAIPALTADDHLTYLSQVADRLIQTLEALASEGLHRPAASSPVGRSIYQSVKSILQGCWAHLGEIQTLKAQLLRQTLDLTGAEGTTNYIYILRPHRRAMLTEGMRPAEEAIFGQHWAYLSELTERGLVLLTGRTRNVDAGTFGLALLNSANEAEARQIMENDPGVKLGLMHGRLFPFRIALKSFQ